MKNGWQTKKLGDVATLQRGFDLPTHERTAGIYPLVSSSGISDTHHKSAVNGPGVVTGRSGSIGNVFFIEDDFWPLNTVLYIKDFHGNDPRFVYHLLNHFDLKRFATGTGVPTLNRNFVHDELVFVPTSLPEQQRIVRVLDEAFAGITTAKANAEKNLQNAHALFASYLQSALTRNGDGWVEKSLGETCVMYQPKTIGTKDLVPNGPYPVFGANGIIGRYDKINHEEPQLLVTCRGATCGSVNISEPNSWITGNAMVVRPLDHSLDLKFLEFIFRGGIDISKAITGAAQPQITRTNLSPLLIRFPKSVAEQTKLAEQFESLTEETQRLASIYERKLAALDALKKSLLHQAFTGEL